MQENTFLQSETHIRPVRERKKRVYGNVSAINRLQSAQKKERAILTYSPSRFTIDLLDLKSYHYSMVSRYVMP